MNILVTGGSGYIGSHTVLALLQAGHNVVSLDNFCNSSVESLNRIAHITGRSALLIEGDIRDRNLLDRLFVEQAIDVVMHFAGLKAIGDSVVNPLNYYENNFVGSLNLVQAMTKAGVRRIVFSSSATVYGEPSEIPILESCNSGRLSNPYGRSKLMVEELLQDLANADAQWSIAILRYFNPVSAHESGMIGEDPEGTPTNLLPNISRVASGAMKKLLIYGDDYPTHDGTCVRDYIHVMDLADGHLKALENISDQCGVNIWNLGTGTGYTVLEMVRAFERASGKTVPLEIVARRVGDVAECWADTSKAAKELNWTADRKLDVMMQDLWRWQSNNPNGYKASDG
jgi:UDP-glucose 4-epimerase